MQYGAVIMTIAFDTLKLADRLEAAGMPPQQAKGVATHLPRRPSRTSSRANSLIMVGRR
jgi:hypothetical protein